jgi:hypothetical protein
VRKSKRLEQRLVALQIKYDAMLAEVTRLQIDVHTLKAQEMIRSLDWHRDVPSNN